MSMTVKEHAAYEILRRKTNKSKGLKFGQPGFLQPLDERFRAMSNAELREIAGVTEAPKAPKAPKPGKPKSDPKDVQARKDAWAWRAAEFKAGRKVTYAEACAKFGTTPARTKAKAVTAAKV